LLPECATAVTPVTGVLDSELDAYGVKFAGEISKWTTERVLAVKEAVKAVANQLYNTVGGTSAIDVFRLVYKGLTFSWGYDLASGTCLDIKTGGCTTNAHNINFVKLSDDPLRARNNVIHEMGHAFAKNWPETSPSGSDLEYYRSRPEEVNPAIVLAWAQEYQGLPEHYIPGFPNRPNPANERPGKYYGFASQQNILTWQVAVTKAGDVGEEFADQFLGWTFGKWENFPEGIMRDNFMKKYMPGWINHRINN
jgi:hypothetical protein